MHLNISLDLHHIEDVYIVEHENCGAYKAYLTEAYLKKGEEKRHDEFAAALTTSILATHPYLNVHTFYIDLRGNIKLLRTKKGIKNSCNSFFQGTRCEEAPGFSIPFCMFTL